MDSRLVASRAEEEISDFSGKKGLAEEVRRHDGARAEKCMNAEENSTGKKIKRKRWLLRMYNVR